MATWRQRFIRFLGWWIAAFASIVAVILIVFALYLLFFDYTETLRESLEGELTKVAGAPARIGSINLDVTSYAFELADISVHGKGDDPILTVDRVWGRLRLSEIARLRLHWTELVVQGLRVHLVEGVEGGIELPRDVGGSSALTGAGLALLADRVALEDAELVISNETVPWRLEASNLGLELSRDRGGSYKGTLSYDDGVLTIREHAPIPGSVSAEIELAAGELFVHEARGESELGRLTGRGKLGLGGGLNGRFDVEAEGDLARAANGLLGLELGPGDLAAAASFEGSITVTPDNRELEGTIRWAEGVVRGIPMRSWRGELFWDRQLFQINPAQGQLASGRARASLVQPLPVADHPASLELDVSGASLGEIVVGLAPSTDAPNASAERSFAVDSSITARASLTFPSASRRRIEGTFEISGSPPPEASETGVEGVALVASGQLVAGDVDITSADFESETMTATVSGLYPREGSADIAVDFRSVDLARTDVVARDVRDLLRSVGEPAADAWGIAGRGRARGRLTGRLPHPKFDGALEAPELRFDRLRMDDVEARAVLSRGALSFEDLLGHRGDGVVAGSGLLSFEGIVGSRDFDLDLRFSDWPLSDLSTLLDWDVSADGLATGDLRVRRTSGALGGDAELDVASPVLLGAPFDRAEAKARFENKTVTLEQASVFRGDALVTGALELDIESGAVQGELATRAFPLDGSEVLGLELSGSVDADAALAGHIDAPVVELTAEGSALNVAGADLGDATLSGTIVNDDLELELRLGEDVSLDATAKLRGDTPVSGTLRFVELDAGPWVHRSFESFSETTRVLTTGGAQFTAALRREGSLAVDATLTRVVVVVDSDQLQLESLAPVEARYQDGILRLPRLTLAAETSKLSLGGAVNFTAANVDLQLEGVTDLAVLETFYPNLAATGSVDLSAQVSGGWAAPSLSGRADLDRTSFRLEGFPQAIGGLSGRLVFDNRTIRIPELHGVFGSGPVTFSGAISLEGMSPASVDLAAKGTDMRLRYPEGLVATLDADLALLGGRDEQVLSGQVTLTDAVWTREYDLAAGILTDSEGLGLFDEFSESEALSGLKFDIAIVAPESLRLRNSLAEIDASAELELRGSLTQPVLLGTTEAERGEVYFLGQRYDITAGKVDFVDPTKVEPFIELTAETRVKSYRVELRLTGTSDRFYPELSSDPPLRTVDILRLLSGASERDILIGTEEEEIAGVGVASLLTERLSQELGRRAERLFGLDRFSVDPFLVGRIANPTARVSLGKQITRDLSINYSTNLNATTEAIILIEYTPEGDTSWILSRDEEGDVGIDVKFRKSF